MAKNNIWFKAKKHVWGWYPSSWEGYTVLGIYIAVFVILYYNIDIYSHSVSDTLLAFFPQALVLTIILLLICFFKGEKPRWSRK